MNSLVHQDDETGVGYKATWGSLWRVIALATLIRGLFLVAAFGNFDQDPDAYRKLAGNLLETGVYGWRTEPAEASSGDSGEEVRPTAFRPPLYPALLACIGGVRANWPVAVLHLALGVATVGLVVGLGWRAGLERWGVAAALLIACDPILLNQSTLVMTETLATFLATLTLFFLGTTTTSTPTTSPPLSVGWPAARLAAVTGIVLGLCGLCRPTFLPWIGLIALAQVVLWRRASLNVAAARVAVLVGAALLVLAPWAIRNAIVLGQAKLTTTHGGYTLLLGNNPLFYGFVRAGSPGTWDGEALGRAWQGRSLTAGPDDELWDDLPRLARLAEQQTAIETTPELADDRLAYALAKRYIREQPAMFAWTSVLRACRLWRVVPHRVGEVESNSRRAFRYAVGIWYAILFGLAVWGLAGLGRAICAPPWLYGLELCLVFTVVHALYWSDMRMRAPLLPLVCLAAARGMQSIGARLAPRKA